MLAALIATVVFSAITVPSAVAQSSNAPPIRANSVTSGSIKDGEVKTADISNDAVTSAKIKNGEVKAEDIADGAIPSGAIELNIHRVKGEPINVNPGSGNTATADCPDGGILAGGGFIVNGFMEIIQSTPSVNDDNAWSALAHNDGSNPATVSAHAMCLDFTP